MVGKPQANVAKLFPKLQPENKLDSLSITNVCNLIIQIKTRLSSREKLF